MGFTFPDFPPELSDILLRDDKTLIIIGVIGKSSTPDCNKMTGLDILKSHPSLTSNDPIREGNIKFYYDNSNALFIHFETSYDNHVMIQMLEEWYERDSNDFSAIEFQSYLRQRFAKILLFAIQVCHIIIITDTGNTFDSSYLSLFKSLKKMREKYLLKFLPKFLKNSNAGSFMKEGRLCSPRFIFYFAKCMPNVDGNQEYLNKIEFDVEDDIYKMLRMEFIITNNSACSLFSIPRNKRFVYFNSQKSIRNDPMAESMSFLNQFIEKALAKKGGGDDEDGDNSLDEFRPYKGFARPWRLDRKTDDQFEKKTEVRSFRSLIDDHVREAIDYGFDDSMSKFRGKSHFVTPTMKNWYESFKILHKLLLENPDNPNFEANDSDYKAYLENFQKIIDIDEKFFSECCEHGIDCAISSYNEMLPHHYNSIVHEQRIHQALTVYMKYARGPSILEYEKKVREECESIWKSGKQQCEYPSLRGNPCVMPIHSPADLSEHSSNIVYVSACNCGRTLGHRKDPFTIREANFEFYQIIANSCTTCNKITKVDFPVFEPSINDFKAAPLIFENSKLSRGGSAVPDEMQQNDDFFVSQNSLDDNSLSYPYHDSFTNMMKTKNDVGGVQPAENEAEDDDSDSMDEIVVKIGGAGNSNAEMEKLMLRQPSTTEYLPGMVHTTSPTGLLPLFPSWSLVCIGPSSIYSHNTGLLEHVQSGFFSGANFLLPWDVQVRLENATEWAANYEKNRNRKKNSRTPASYENRESVFTLKIFVGNEYECTRGHRFIMSTPEKILRGGADIVRDSGSKVVLNDMPLYFPCPCRSTSPYVAQMMRVHIVTPKAPVNVIVEPKVRTGVKNSLTFVTGISEPVKLSQSTYWILRLPYVYQGDDGPILPPIEVAANSAISHGYLQGGMFGIAETEKSTIVQS